MLLTTAVLLAGCTSVSPHQVNQLHNQVSELNRELSQLTRQARTIEQQNSLNVNSGQGAWLIPDAKKPIVLRSQIGNLSLSLITPDADNYNNEILLHIHAVDKGSLQTFSAQIEWGKRDNVSKKLLPASNQTQWFHVDAGLAGNQDVIVPLHLNGIQSVQLSYVRIHNVVPDGEK